MCLRTYLSIKVNTWHNGNTYTQGTAGKGLAIGMHRGSVMGYNNYGLMRCIWRKLRALSGGACYIRVYNKQGEDIGEVFLYRYAALVELPSDVAFKDISWLCTIKNLRPDPIAEAAFMGGNDIAIGIDRFG